MLLGRCLDASRHLWHAPACLSALLGALRANEIAAVDAAAGRTADVPSCSYTGSLRTSAPVRWASRKRAVTAKADAPSIPDDRHAAVQLAIAEINKKLGQGTIMEMGASKFAAVDCIPTGCLQLDAALGGGWPRGKIVEVFGPESSGKTTLALHAIAEVQRKGGTALLIDAEHAYNEAFAKSIGVNTDKFYICQPQTGDDALQVVDRLARSGGVDLIVVDSVAALVPRSEVEADVGTPTIGAQARLMSSSLRKLVSSAAKMDCTVLFLNQLRHKVGVIFGSPEVTSGGNALKFYASARVDLRRTGNITGTGEEPIGIRVRAKVVKNKCNRPYRMAEFDVLFEGGINSAASLLDTAEQCGLVERRGAWYYCGEQRLGQGKEKALAALKAEPELLQRLEQQVKESLAGQQQQQGNSNARGRMTEVADEGDWLEDKEGQGPATA